MAARKMKYGFVWVTLGFFAFSFVGHWVFAWFAYANEARARGAEPVASEYLFEVSRDTLENWQSEFLQLVWQVVGLSWLWYVGSSQSSEGQNRVEEKLDYLLDQTERGRATRTQLDTKYPRE